jgi:hypothetical protein
MKSTNRLIAGAWTLSLIAATLAIAAWGAGLNWQFARFSTYKLFPLFGLLAFSLMWAHYIVAAARLLIGVDKAVLKNFFELTSLMVLMCILLHPGLLIWRLWQDGLGLPPGSVLDNYVAGNAKWAATLGVIALVFFLAFELHRWYSEREWWKYVQYASDVGMVLIFIHAMKLGGDLQPGWFRMVWWMYGLSLLLAFVYIWWKQKFIEEK